MANIGLWRLMNKEVHPLLIKRIWDAKIKSRVSYSMGWILRLANKGSIDKIKIAIRKTIKSALGLERWVKTKWLWLMMESCPEFSLVNETRALCEAIRGIRSRNQYQRNHFGRKWTLKTRR